MERTEADNFTQSFLHQLTEWLPMITEEEGMTMTVEDQLTVT